MIQFYPFLFLDAVHYSVRTNGKVVKRAAYVILGINLEGKKDVIGIYIGENETSKFWLQVLTDMKSRGVKDVLISSIDGLPGFSEAIRTVFSKGRSTKMYSSSNKKYFRECSLER